MMANAPGHRGKRIVASEDFPCATKVSPAGATVPIRLAYAAALVGTTVYLIGFAAGFWLPEPKDERLPA